MKLGFMQGRLSPTTDGRIQSFPWKNWQLEFSDAQKIGFHLMEWTIDTNNYGVNPIFSSVSEIKQLIEKHEINVPSLTNDHFMERPPWDLGEKIARDNLLKLTRAMHEIGAELLVIPLVDNSSIKGNTGKEEFLKVFFTKIQAELASNNVRICFEVDLDPESTTSFISDFSSDFFGINYDIGNSAALGYDPILELTLYGNRIFNVHIKDRTLGGNTIKLGEGCADFPTIFKILRESEYAGNYILQTARALDDNHESALIYSKNFAEKFLQGSS
jgi:L-ribulose-5-phosphate 3-epimerase